MTHEWGRNHKRRTLLKTREYTLNDYLQNKNKATHNESKLLVNYFSPKETRSENKFLRVYKHDNDEIKKSPWIKNFENVKDASEVITIRLIRNKKRKAHIIKERIKPKISRWVGG